MPIKVFVERAPHQAGSAGKQQLLLHRDTGQQPAATVLWSPDMINIGRIKYHEAGKVDKIEKSEDGGPGHHGLPAIRTTLTVGDTGGQHGERNCVNWMPGHNCFKEMKEHNSSPKHHLPGWTSKRPQRCANVSPRTV